MPACALRSLALLPLLAVCSGEMPRFAPEQGSRLSKTFREESQLELDSIVMRIDGEERPRPDVHFELKGTRQLTVTDEYVALADGRMQRLRREFGELETKIEGESDDGSGASSFDLTGHSELEDAVVLFELEDDSYTASFEVAEGRQAPDAALLASLREDMDLRACLPTEEVAEGDTWDIDAAAFAGVLAPGGAIEFAYEGGDEHDPEPALLFAHLFVVDAPESVSGTVKASWLPSRKEEERELGRMALEIDLQFTTDLSERVRAAAAESGMDPTLVEGLKHFGLEASWKGEGVVEWEMTAGRVHGATLEGDVGYHLELESQQGAGQTITMESVLDFVGKSKLTLVTEVP